MDDHKLKLGLIMLAHRGPTQVARLLTLIRHPQVRVYLHVDRRVDLGPFRRALAEASVQETSLLRRLPTRWGGYEVVSASIDGLARARADGCTYVMLVSGQDVPLRPIAEIVEFASRAGKTSYVEHFPLPASHWRFNGRERTEFYTYTVRGRRETCIPRGEDTGDLSRRGAVLNQALRLRGAFRPPRRFPSYAQPFGGSQWWNMSRPAVDHVLAFVDLHPGYREYHRHTLLPDELFFHSILCGTAFAYDHRIVNDALRFMIWADGSSHPKTLTFDDVPTALKSDGLFARKLDLALDADAVRALTQRLIT